MADRWFPSDYWHPYLDETWRNFFENHANVQFNHRALAHLLILGVVAFPFLVRKAGITGLARTSADLCALLAVGQGTLGPGDLTIYITLSFENFIGFKSFSSFFSGFKLQITTKTLNIIDF